MWRGTVALLAGLASGVLVPPVLAGDLWPIEDHLPAQACVILSSPKGVQVQNQALCEVPHSPCSTFKMPHALIALDLGIVNGPDHELAWDGTERRRAVTNRNHTLASAIEHSVVWYFQETARNIGVQRMQDRLEALGYGNRDISGGIDNFWLASSLKLTAFEQLYFIQALRQQTLPFTDIHQQQLHDMLRVADSDASGLHGKTGSCWPGRPGEQDYAWFAGWLDTRSGPVDIVALHREPSALGSDLKQAVSQLFSASDTAH